jgi:hypothetical protein
MMPPQHFLATTLYAKLVVEVSELDGRRTGMSMRPS